MSVDVMCFFYPSCFIEHMGDGHLPNQLMQQ